MSSIKNNHSKIILAAISLFVLVFGVILFFIPPALFPDPANGFQVLRSMHLGGGFNNFVAPDQSDISQDYTEYLTWWSPGQYLVPYFFKLITGTNIGHAISITVLFASLTGLAGFFAFFKKVGFSPLIASLSLLLVFVQVAFFVPFVYYNGGEILLFALEGWFLLGCASIKRPGIKLLLFVLLSGWIGFFFKSSFIWIYFAGLICLWIRFCQGKTLVEWIKEGLWVGLPALISLVCVYLLFLSKGENPTSATKGLKLTVETLSFPLASPILSGFSIDDLVHGLIYHIGSPLFTFGWSLVILLLLAALSLLLIIVILRVVPNNDYKLFMIVFYAGAFLFFGFSYLRQLTISYEARHFRLLGILIVPGIILLVSRLKIFYKLSFTLICLAITCFSFHYLFKGFYLNKNVSAKGVTGIAQPNIDQQSLNKLMQLDNRNRNATFVFVSNDIGLEVQHNRIINLPPVADDLHIDMDDYTYQGFAGPLYIILPESYNGPKEKMIMKSFPDYAGWNESMLSNNFVLYFALRKRQIINSKSKFFDTNLADHGN